MGFHIICIVGYLFGIPVLLLWKAAPNSRSFCPLRHTASRKAFQRCCKQSLIITPEITHYMLEQAEEATQLAIEQGCRDAVAQALRYSAQQRPSTGWGAVRILFAKEV